jgi:hypothetical protein
MRKRKNMIRFVKISRQRLKNRKIKRRIPYTRSVREKRLQKLSESGKRKREESALTKVEDHQNPSQARQNKPAKFRQAPFNLRLINLKATRFANMSCINST